MTQMLLAPKRDLLQLSGWSQTIQEVKLHIISVAEEKETFIVGIIAKKPNFEHFESSKISKICI